MAVSAKGCSRRCAKGRRRRAEDIADAPFLHAAQAPRLSFVLRQKRAWSWCLPRSFKSHEDARRSALIRGLVGGGGPWQRPPLPLLLLWWHFESCSHTRKQTDGRVSKPRLRGFTWHHHHHPLPPTSCATTSFSFPSLTPSLPFISCVLFLAGSAHLISATGPSAV